MQYKIWAFSGTLCGRPLLNQLYCAPHALGDSQINARLHYSLLISHRRAQLQNYNFSVTQFPFHVLNPLLLHFLQFLNYAPSLRFLILCAPMEAWLNGFFINSWYWLLLSQETLQLQLTFIGNYRKVIIFVSNLKKK